MERWESNQDIETFEISVDDLRLVGMWIVHSKSGFIEKFIDQRGFNWICLSFSFFSQFIQLNSIVFFQQKKRKKQNFYSILNLELSEKPSLTYPVQVEIFFAHILSRLTLVFVYLRYYHPIQQSRLSLCIFL